MQSVSHKHEENKIFLGRMYEQDNPIAGSQVTSPSVNLYSLKTVEQGGEERLEYRALHFLSKCSTTVPMLDRFPMNYDIINFKHYLVCQKVPHLHLKFCLFRDSTLVYTGVYLTFPPGNLESTSTLA